MIVYEHVKSVRNKLKNSQISDLPEEDFVKSCQRLANRWQYLKLAERRKAKLCEMDVSVFDFLIRHKLKPSTVYKWFLLTKIHPDLQQKLANKEISQKDAFSVNHKFKRILNVTEQELKQDLDNLIVRYIRK